MICIEANENKKALDFYTIFFSVLAVGFFSFLVYLCGMEMYRFDDTGWWAIPELVLCSFVTCFLMSLFVARDILSKVIFWTSICFDVALITLFCFGYFEVALYKMLFI